MKKIVNFMWTCSIIIVLYFFIAVSIGVYAEDCPTTYIQDEPTTSPTDTINNDDDFADEKNEQIESLIEENKRNQEIIESYQSLYSIWTIILTALLAVFGVLIPILLPFIMNKINETKLKKEIEKFQQYNNKQYEKMFLIQNALVLSALEDYWASNECFKRIKNSYPDDPYINIYMARNSFRELLRTIPDEEQKVIENEKQIYETINLFIDWFYETKGILMDKLMIGNIYSDNTIIEVSTLIGYLADCDQLNRKSDFIQICKKACKYILDNLKISTDDEIYDLDQTDVYIMNYKQLNFYLCKAYYNNKNISLKNQLHKTIRLYNADDFSRCDDNLKQCEQMMSEINNW